MWNKFKRSTETLLDNNDRDLFKHLQVCTLETQLGKKSISIPKKREKLKVLRVKAHP